VRLAGLSSPASENVVVLCANGDTVLNRAGKVCIRVALDHCGPRLVLLVSRVLGVGVRAKNLSALALAAYAEKLEEMLRVKLIKIAHYDQCVLIEIAATLALNQFQKTIYSRHDSK
jgi:hypothetical protein